MAQVDDKLAIMTKKDVLYFRPERVMAEEESKDGTIQLDRSKCQVLSGCPEGHTMVGMVAYR